MAYLSRTYISKKNQKSYSNQNSLMNSLFTSAFGFENKIVCGLQMVYNAIFMHLNILIHVIHFVFHKIQIYFVKISPTLLHHNASTFCLLQSKLQFEASHLTRLSRHLTMSQFKTIQTIKFYQDSNRFI